MSKIDKIICKYSGSKNYMDQLAKVTGHIFNVNREFYTSQIKNVKSCYQVIISELNKYQSERLTTFITKINKAYKKLNLDLLFHDVVKKQKTVNKVRIYPKDIYNSEWYTLLNELNKDIINVVEQFNIKQEECTAEQKELMKDPIFVDSFRFMDIKIDNKEITKSIYTISKFLDRITDIILTPMYNVKKYIDEHWLDEIDNAFNLKTSGIKQPLSQDEIKEYLVNFVNIKYRMDITGNAADLTKVLMNNLDLNKLNDLEPSKFINIIDGIKGEYINSNKNIKKMVDVIKEKVNDIDKGKFDIVSFMNEINSSLDETEQETKSVQTEADDVF